MEGSGDVQALSTPSPAAAVSTVLNDPNLLGEILLRLDFPTQLVRAALTCRCCLRVASDPVFLRRFRDLHPPRLLGFYVNAVYWSGHERPEFWPVHHAPELASAVRHAAAALDVDAFTEPDCEVVIGDYRNDRLLASISAGRIPLPPLTHAVFSHAGDKVVLPPPPLAPLARPMVSRSRKILPDNGGGDDDLRCLDLVVAKKHGLPHRAVQVNELRQGVWSIRASATTEHLQSKIIPKVLLVGDKLYMATQANILVLSLTSSPSSISVIDFPEPMDDDFHGGRMSKADDSGIYLIKVVDSFEMSIGVWLHSTVAGSWVLVDTISVRKVFADLGVHLGLGLQCDVLCVGDNGKFVLLQMDDGSVFYMDIPSRTVEAVFKATTISRFTRDIPSRTRRGRRIRGHKGA